jgi:hypothetical protein
MGYGVYLVKARNWFDDENKFTETERNVIRARHGVADWLYFGGEQVSVKNPSREEIIALVRIAKTFGWAVQGDDGETYAEDGSPIPVPPSPEQGFFGRLRRLLNEYRVSRAIQKRMRGVGCPFKVGDRVRTTHRRGGVVIEIDPKGHQGMGSIKVTFPDGTILGGTFIANDFRKEP